MSEMQGRVVVITGATSGIGLVAAERLAGMGARMVLVGRDRTRGEAAMDRLPKPRSGRPHSIHYADLSKISDMKRVSAEIAAAEPQIDVLINNAGAMFGSRQRTSDGLEMTFALNHLSYFVVTLGLRERLQASRGARVVNTSSDAHKGNRLDFLDLQSAEHYRGFGVYGRSKLCNILFTRELARRWRDTGITANCLHPGFVATRFGDGSGGVVGRFIGLAKLFAISPEKGAETIVYLAASSEVASVSGEYFYKCHQAEPTAEAKDDHSAKRLWDESARMTGLG